MSGSSVHGNQIIDIRFFSCSWSFETQRYFGAEHLRIKETLLVTLRPRELPFDSDSDSDY